LYIDEKNKQPTTQRYKPIATRARNSTMYEIIQSTLTNLIEFTVIAGFAGTLAMSLVKKHRRWMAIYAPVAPYVPNTESEVKAQPEVVEEDIWEAPITPSPDRMPQAQPVAVRPTLMLPPAKKQVAANPPKPEIELSNLDVPTLRKLCDRHQIRWRDALGKNRHMRKAVMVFQLQQRSSAKSA
jgi:hypothetical protein